MSSTFIVRSAKSAGLAALTLLFAIGLITASAKASTADEVTFKTSQTLKSELVQVAKLSRKAARAERRAERRARRKEARQECRTIHANRQDRRNCIREAMQEIRADKNADSDDAGATTDSGTDTVDRGAD